MTFRRVFILAALAVALLVATGASSQAAYTLSESAITSSPSPPTIGGTAFTLTPSSMGMQSGITASNFNVIDVGVSSTTPTTGSDSGSITLSQTYTLTGTTGTETAVLSATLQLMSGNSGGVVSSIPIPGTVTVTAGSGFTVAYASYAPPSPGSSGTGATVGNVSITVTPITPFAVPEPASMVMLGSGVVGVLGLGLRRRLKKA